MKKVVLSLFLMAIASWCDAQYNPRPTKSRFFNSKHSTFQTKPGDILVYTFETGGQASECAVTVGAKQNSSIKSAVTYSCITLPNQILTKSIWLDPQNWRDLASRDKTTKMDMGGGIESFVREEASTYKITYKGKEKILTVYKIVNQNAANSKSFVVLTDEKNPLIISMDAGEKIALKEVR